MAGGNASAATDGEEGDDALALVGVEGGGTAGAAGPRTSWSCRSVGVVRSRWSLNFTSVQPTSPCLTKPCTGLPNPEAAVLPALVSVFDSEVTLLAPMMTRSAWVCAAFRSAILS